MGAVWTPPPAPPRSGEGGLRLDAPPTPRMLKAAWAKEFVLGEGGLRLEVGGGIEALCEVGALGEAGAIGWRVMDAGEKDWGRREASTTSMASAGELSHWPW